MAIVDGYIYNRDVRSSDFRALFTLQFNQWAKRADQKKPEKLWPLSIDFHTEELTAAEMFERNRKLIEQLGAN